MASRLNQANFELIYLNYLLRHKNFKKCVKISSIPDEQRYFDFEDVLEINKRRTPSMCHAHFDEDEAKHGLAPIRNCFNNCDISEDDRIRTMTVVQRLVDDKIPIPQICEVYNYIGRAVLMNYRAHKDDYVRYTVDQVKKYIKWRHSSFFPISDDEKGVRKHLEAGTCYWIGRAQNKRPVLVIKAANAKPYTDCVALDRAVTFAFEWSKMHLLIPGVQETSYVILDVTGMSISNTPINDIKHIIDNLTLRYPFHMDKIFVINDSYLLQGAWSVVKNFLSDVQKAKVHIHRKSIPKNTIEKVFGPGLIEKCYGGDRENVKQYYPFPIKSDNATDQAYSRFLDPICLVGIPQIHKNLPHMVNSDHTGKVESSHNLSNLRRKSDNESYGASVFRQYADFEEINPRVSCMITLNEKAVLDLRSYFGEDANYMMLDSNEKPISTFRKHKSAAVQQPKVSSMSKEIRSSQPETVGLAPSIHGSRSSVVPSIDGCKNMGEVDVEEPKEVDRKAEVDSKPEKHRVLRRMSCSSTASGLMIVKHPSEYVEAVDSPDCEYTHRFIKLRTLEEYRHSNRQSKQSCSGKTGGTTDGYISKASNNTNQRYSKVAQSTSMMTSVSNSTRSNNASARGHSERSESYKRVTGSVKQAAVDNERVDKDSSGVLDHAKSISSPIYSGRDHNKDSVDAESVIEERKDEPPLRIQIAPKLTLQSRGTDEKSRTTSSAEEHAPKSNINLLTVDECIDQKVEHFDGESLFSTSSSDDHIRKRENKSKKQGRNSKSKDNKNKTKKTKAAKKSGKAPKPKPKSNRKIRCCCRKAQLPEPDS